MSTDVALISYVVRKPHALIQLQRAGVVAEDFHEDYQAAWRYITRMKRTEGSVPSRAVVEHRFPDLDLVRTREGDLPILLTDLRKRRKWREFLEIIDGAAGEAGNPDDIDEVIVNLQAKVNSLAFQNGHGSHIADLFSHETNLQMLQEVRKRRHGEALGIRTGLNRIDLGGGLHKKRMIVVMGRPGLGKAQPLSAKVLTPSGWKKMGTLTEGSTVLCPDGRTATILQVHPQGVQSIYRVTFSDGASTEATADHLWKTQTRNERKRGVWSVKTTREIASSLRYDNHWNHYIPLVDPVHGYTTSLSVDPYVVGVLLGDGHVRTRKGTTEVLLTSADPELVDEVNRRLPVGSFTASKKLCYRFTDGSNAWYKTSTLRADLVSLGMGSGYAHTKKIPSAYMSAPIHVRHELLQGLLDTDGSPCGRTSAEFCSTSKVLAQQVRKLVWSLGGTCTLSDRVTNFTASDGEKQCGRRSYRLMITLPEGVDYFKLARKQGKIKPGQKRGRSVRTVRSIEFVRNDEAQCISIDHADQLYVTDNYIVTHNSWMNLLFVAQAIIDGYSVMLFPLEMTLQETAFRLYTIFSQKMFGADRVLKNTDLNMGYVSKKRLIHFLKVVERKFAGKLLVADVSSLNDAYTPDRLEAEVELYRPDMFWVDGLTLMKAPGGYDADDHVAIKTLSNAVKGIAQRHDCVGGASTQVNRSALSGRYFLPRLENIAYGDSIGQDADQVIPINRRGNALFYAMVKNRHGPEISKTRVRFFVDSGVIEEDEVQGEDDDE